MEDQVLILIPLRTPVSLPQLSPLHSKLNTPDKGDIEAKFDDVDNQTFPFDRTNQTRIFRRIMYVHAG